MENDPQIVSRNDGGKETNCRCRALRRAGSPLALIGGVLAVLAPKCPMCLAAYLAFLGIGSATAGTMAPFLLPVGIALLVFAGITMGVMAYNRVRSSRPTGPS